MKQSRMVFGTLVVVAALAGAFPGGAAASAAPGTPAIEVVPSQATFKGKGTDAMFPKALTLRYSGESVELFALGSGVRKKMVFKVYEAIAYAEEGAGLTGDPYRPIIEGDFAKRVVMYFLRDVEGGKIRGAWSEGFSKNIDEDELTPELVADRDRFTACFKDEGLKKGEAIELTWLPGHGLHLAIAGTPTILINNPALASGLWAIWFGEKPISGGLKKDMVRFLGEDD